MLGFFLTLVELDALAVSGLGGENEEEAPLLGADEEAAVLPPESFVGAATLGAEALVGAAAALAPEASETAAVALAPDDDAAAFLVPVAAAVAVAPDDDAVDGGAVLVNYI